MVSSDFGQLAASRHLISGIDCAIAGAATDAAAELRGDIAFFQGIKSALARPSGQPKSPEEADRAIRQRVA